MFELGDYIKSIKLGTRIYEIQISLDDYYIVGGLGRANKVFIEQNYILATNEDIEKMKLEKEKNELEFKTQNTVDLICPYCFSKQHKDSFDSYESGIENHCDECDKDFTMNVIVTRIFQTFRKD